ncbi:nucleotide exchange factor GrpE [Paraprevotella clara]|uniref:Protein GrpE n=1 Tax=Paraprevotella clara YIT 11840 TaxID=762968 RepID=G5SU24_9BACT|nr:nucleotide exchange factor GrpE [Paraprevotella clara]EHG99267.1 co-chaperone GrpE [Paraprevotella clara YIT 11840]
MEKNKDMNEEELKAQQEETLDNVATSQLDEGDKAEEQPAKEMSVEDKLAAAETKVAELQDKYLRQVAEFDNYRKRTIKEKAELILNGAEKTITAILPILDDMERALKNMDKMEDVAAVKEGVDLIFQKFVKILGEQGVKKIETENADFNTDLHEAIAQVPAPSDEMKGKIIDCVKTGYTLNEKVIRHSQVAVGL